MYLCNDKVTEEMTVALAHEVKNPVSLIKANIEFLELSENLSAYEKNIKIIKKELNKISDIMSDFILSCKPVCERNIEEINIFYLIKEKIEELAISNNKNNIEFWFNCFCDTENLNIVGEYSKICMLLSNIYKNSIEAINYNGIIKTNISMCDNNIIVDIIDDGEGIKDDIKDKIYKPFITNKKDGSGLGIPICVNIMKEIEGDFIIFNNEGKGCTARLTFNKVLT